MIKVFNFYFINNIMSISITLMGKDKHYKYIGDVKGIVNFINLLEAGKTVEEAAILLF